MSEWISVKDKLPTEYSWVMISYVDEMDPKLRFVPSTGELREGKWVTKESEIDGLKRKSHIDFEKDYLVKVTHWMPLPSPPK